MSASGQYSGRRFRKAIERCSVRSDPKRLNDFHSAEGNWDNRLFVRLKMHGLFHLVACRLAAQQRHWKANNKERADISVLVFIFKVTLLFSCQLALLPCPIFGSYAASDTDMLPKKTSPLTAVRAVQISISKIKNRNTKSGPKSLACSNMREFTACPQGDDKVHL